MSSAAEILIVVPVLGRPDRAAPLVASVQAATQCEWRLVFVATHGDRAEVDACVAVARGTSRVQVHMCDWPAGPGDYARKINWAYSQAAEPYVLCAADDLRFHPGWDAAVLELADRLDVGVVGTNDLGNNLTVMGRHSTHPLVARCYIEVLGGYVGGQGRVYFEGYDHQWADNELVQTAIARGCYAHAPGAVVEHLHPLWGKAQRDATYAKALARGDDDRRLFESRRGLWELERVPA